MINEQIRDREIRLIGENGEQLGIMSARDAYKMAQEAELDLVKIAPTAKPPVCKIIDYGKYRYELARKEKEARKKQKVIDVKEVRLSPNIDTNDLNTKVYRALWNFSLPMLTGGVLCISILMHEYYDILASVMLLFYGLALVNVSKFTYSSIVWLGYAFICLGVVDCFWEGHSLLFWTIGFGGFHILYGILFYLHYERKRS